MQASSLQLSWGMLHSLISIVSLQVQGKTQTKNYTDFFLFSFVVAPWYLCGNCVAVFCYFFVEPFEMKQKKRILLPSIAQKQKNIIINANLDFWMERAKKRGRQSRTITKIQKKIVGWYQRNDNDYVNAYSFYILFRMRDSLKVKTILIFRCVSLILNIYIFFLCAGQN